MEDANRRTAIVRQYTDVTGSPYLTDSWLKGAVKTSTGKNYANLDLKYDQVADEVFFKNKTGEAFSFTEQIQEFNLVEADGNGLTTLTFRNGYKPSNGFTEKAYYQILTDRETALVKRVPKKLAEQKSYGSATINKEFVETPTYYLVKSGLPVKIKKDKKSVLETLGDYQTETAEFIQKNKLNLKSDADLIKLINFYNSLK